MKYLVAFALLAFSLNAYSVDITITLSAGDATRAAAACGKMLQLVDAKNVPRSCTMAEAKGRIIQHVKQWIEDTERPALEQQLGPVVVPAFTPS